MRYNKCPRAFKVGHWRRLYDACISNLETVEKIASNATFVVFDAEPWGRDTTRAAELGISMLRISSTRQTSAPSATLEDFAKFCNVETHWIQIAELQRPKKGERHRFGQQHTVASLDAETYLIGLVASFQHKSSAASDRVMFAGFGLQFEFHLLSTIYNGFTECFTSWLDLQELARLASRAEMPGLSETLKACGFGLEDPRDLHSLQGKHNPATDTVRAAAVLRYFLGHLQHGQVLEIGTSDRNAKTLSRRLRGSPANAPEERQLWAGVRPRPTELYPYAARVRRSTDDVLTPNGLLEAFAEYQPVAVGSAKQHRGRYGWVCLASLHGLDTFVQQMNGADHEHGGTCIVVSDYDPDIVPAKDMRELKDRLHSHADEKREQRRIKKLGESAVATVEGYSDTHPLTKLLC